MSLHKMHILDSSYTVLLRHDLAEGEKHCFELPRSRFNVHSDSGYIECIYIASIDIPHVLG